MARALLLVLACLGVMSIYRSQDGFQFAVPPGWAAKALDPHMVLLVQQGWEELGREVFVVQTCSGEIPTACLRYREWPATLTETRQARLSGLPATEFRFLRRNKPQNWTREWTEVHTILVSRGTPYDVAALIPPHLAAEYWGVYDLLRDSFRLTNGQPTRQHDDRNARKTAGLGQADGLPGAILSLELLRASPRKGEG